MLFRYLPVFVLIAILFSPPRCNSQVSPANSGGENAATPGPVLSKTFPHSKIREQVLGELPSGAQLDGALSSESRLAWVEKIGDKRTVRLDGKQVGTTYDDVKFLSISHDQEHLAFVAKRNSKWVVVLDGEEKTKEYGMITYPALSDDGKHFACGVCSEKKCQLVLDGEELGPVFEDISYPIFSRDGAHYGYLGKRSKRWVALLDGKQTGPEMRNFSSWQFSREGGHFAIAALLDGFWTWIVDGKSGRSYEVISPITFSSDGKHFAFAGSSSKSSGFSGKKSTLGSLVLDGEVKGTYQGKGFGGGWQGMFGSYEMISGVRSLDADFHGLSSPRLAQDGSPVYGARTPEGEVVVFFMGEHGPPVEDLVSPVIFTPDGKHVGYVVRKGDSFVEMQNHKPGAIIPAKRDVSFVPQIMISRDGGHLAYEVMLGGKMFKEGYTERALRRVVLDGAFGPEFDCKAIQNITISEGGKHHFYEVHGAQGERDQVVFDGMEGLYYDDVFRNSTRFLEDHAIEFVAKEGQRLLRVTESLN